MNLTNLLAVGTMYDFSYKDMWKDIVLDSRIDKDTLINSIIMACCDSKPYVNTWAGFKQQSDSFFKKWQYQITKLMDTQGFVYNPIWNRDGTVTHTLTSSREKGTTDSYTENNDNTSGNTNENTVSAFDSSSYQPHDKDVNSSHSNTDITSNRDIDETEGYGESFKEISQGNIGVTSTQSLIEEERKLYEFNIYDWIVDKYQNELFMKVW